MAIPDVTEAELGVLRRLWEEPGSTIRQLTDHLYPGGGAAHYSTVQKLLERLETKGCVKRQAGGGAGGGGAHRFVATVEREELVDGRLKAVADKFCEGSLTPLVTQLVRAGKFTPDEIRELRALIETHAARGARRQR
jgi:BlaI family transcriptional regulator, penicillinase repressor